MTTFIIYVALPALFFQLLAKTPFAKLAEWGFIFGSVFSTFVIFSTMFVASLLVSRGRIAESTVAALAAAYGNIGYMGPGLALLAFGEEAAVPVALIFCFENIMHFAIVPLLMALSGDDKEHAAAAGVERDRQDRHASVHHRHRPRRARGLFRVPAAAAGRALPRLPAARRGTLRAVCDGRDAGAEAAEARAGRDCADRRC